MIKLNMELPAEVARRSAEDMLIYFWLTDQHKRDEIAVRQLHALRQHRRHVGPTYPLGRKGPV